MFPDFPFPSHLPSHLSHQDVLKYLQDYVEYHNLNQFIEYETLVERVKPVALNHVLEAEKVERKLAFPCNGKNIFNDCRKFKDNVRWKVSTVHMESGKRSTEEYDAVLVCSG